MTVLIGFLVNIIQFKLTDVLVPKLTKDIEYFAPLAVVLGLFLYPISYTLIYFFTVDYFHFTVLEKVGYFFAMPLSGLLAYSYYRYYLHISYKWKYMFHMMNNRKSMLEIQQKRSVLRSIIFE